MADTTNATCYGGIDVPHWKLSAAKIDIIPETHKHFTEINTKKGRWLLTIIPSLFSFVLTYRQEVY
jgi:hypothetical protein